MEIVEMRKWLTDFAHGMAKGAYFEDNGECGFGRSCVGISIHGSYPDYDCEDDAQCPPPETKDAYHKHDCLAVLNHGNTEEAIRQLYAWCRKLESNGYKRIAIAPVPLDPKIPSALSILLGKHESKRIVRADV
jgi:hypothetical protein